MHFPSDRFDVTTAEKRRLAAFREYIWSSPEVCNECFTRIREVDDHPAASELSAQSLRNLPARYHERTEDSAAEWCSWDHNDRYGTTFCLNCGSDSSRQTINAGLDALKDQLINLLQYTLEHTPYHPDGRRAARELQRLHSRRDTSGYESEMLALAWVRGVEPEHAPDTAARPADDHEHPARAD